MAPNPSLKSVAAAAGVSVSSVSNAYNKPEQLSEPVRARILQVAREQGYAGPDAAARSLRSRRAGAIGVLFTEQLSYAFSDPYSVGLLAGIAEAAEAHRAGLLLIPIAPRHSDDPDAVDTSVRAVRQAVVDGVVAYCVDSGHPALEVVHSRGLPIVSTNDDPDMTSYVLIDEAGSTAALAVHLRKLGHRHVGVVLAGHTHGDSLEVLEADESELLDFEQNRLRGIRVGLGRGARIVAVTAGYNSSESGRVAAEELLDRADRPTAIMATSDVMALGVLQALEQRKLVAGRDISVTGFDDVPAAGIAGLTTVRQPIRERGRLLGRMLLDPDQEPSRVVLPTSLVVRASTGPVPR